MGVAAVVEAAAVESAEVLVDAPAVDVETVTVVETEAAADVAAVLSLAVEAV